MKIAFLNLYSGINNRGAESFSEELARRLSDKNEVKFYSGEKVNFQVVQPEHQQPKNIFQMLRKRLFLDQAAISVFKFTTRILPELKGERFNVIIPMNGFWQVLLCKIFLRSKILITGHSGPGWDERWNLYLKPDVFVATTEPTAKWAMNVCHWTKVVTIPYGIEIEKFQKAKAAQLDLERPVVLCPAAAVPYKRVDLAIRAVAKMTKGSLLYLGTGYLSEELDRFGKQLLGERYLHKAVPYFEMPQYYAVSNVVTLPSESQENSPMVFLEAMAAGKSIVATDTARNRWMIGGAGRYVDPEDTEEYARNLEEGLEIDNNVIREQAKKYSWDRIVREYENMIKEISHDRASRL